MPERRVILVVGKRGSGKTTFVRTKLLPVLAGRRTVVVEDDREIEQAKMATQLANCHVVIIRQYLSDFTSIERGQFFTDIYVENRDFHHTRLSAEDYYNFIPLPVEVEFE